MNTQSEPVERHPSQQKVVPAKTGVDIRNLMSKFSNSTKSTKTDSPREPIRVGKLKAKWPPGVRPDNKSEVSNRDTSVASSVGKVSSKSTWPPATVEREPETRKRSPEIQSSTSVMKQACSFEEGTAAEPQQVHAMQQDEVTSYSQPEPQQQHADYYEQAEPEPQQAHEIEQEEVLYDRQAEPDIESQEVSYNEQTKQENSQYQEVPTTFDDSQDVGDQGITATSIYAYDAEADDELSFVEDVLITNISKDHEDWWHGTYGGRTGIFPANFVKENV